MMNKLTLTGSLIIILLMAVSILAPFISTHDPQAIDIKAAYLGPSAQHLFGTDFLGRDLFSRIIWASRVALSIGIVAVGIAAVIGVILGAIAGYFGGKTDSVIMRFTDMMLCFPTLFLILSVVAFIGPGLFNIMVIIGFTSWMGIARLIRAEILSLKKREFILVSRALGRNDLFIIIKHLIPNAIGPVLVNVVFGVAGAILTEVGLSFLGLGIQPPDPSWGNILLENKSAMGVAWWGTVFPGLAIFITVLGFNLLGEGVRDMLNPRTRR